ncbi:MAG TPA: AAA family ATPase, partial [Usitatibacter sp.]|nr:AAA family ATPase [Usitatibacter sp.]
LAAMTRSMPVVEMELAPGESRTLPPLPLCDAPLVVVTGRHGAWSCADGRAMLSIDVPLPRDAERARHWRASLPGKLHDALPECAPGMRLSSGGIRVVAAAARGFARLAGRESLEAADIRRACRTLQSARLETLATRLEAKGVLADLSVDEATREELDALVARCRYREQLAADAAAVADGSIGVRALFGGPSGCGKTLAARLLAADIGKDLYRIDLSATVNKYLGETEKSLNRALNAAEELDVVLLLDEGDSLMANRTGVGSSNDRYANLETNFLLQRIESFEGILVVTTNAVDRIDHAFARRMDVVVNFRAPDAWLRFEILKRHLGPGAIDDAWLEDAASRCALSGGQWRNVVTHARLLALRTGMAVAEEHLHAALAREYRKTGASCPLRAVQARRCPR